MLKKKMCRLDELHYQQQFVVAE